MQQSTGKIFNNPTDDEVLKHRLTELTDAEHSLVRDLPEEDRPLELAVIRYVQDRRKLGRVVSIQSKTDFRMGYRAGRDSMKGHS